MKKSTNLLILIGFIGLITTLWTTAAEAIPLTGASVSISSAQYTLNDNQFTTAVDGSTIGNTGAVAGPNTVVVTFYDENNVKVGTFTNATLEVFAVDFSGGFTNGVGGGFTILDSDHQALLSGDFGNGSSLVSATTGAEFQTSMVVKFYNDNLINFHAPGLFSATLGDIGTLTPGSDFTTKGSATARIQSSPAPVPEPATLLMLGTALLFLGVYKARIIKQNSACRNMESK